MKVYYGIYSYHINFLEQISNTIDYTCSDSYYTIDNVYENNLSVQIVQ